MSSWTSEVLTLQGSDREKWRNLVERIPENDIYFTPEYAQLFEMTEGKTRERFGGDAELFFYGNDKNYIIHPIFKKKINDLEFYKGDTIFYDVASPWYYGGPLAFFTDMNVKKELYNNFFKEFHNYCVQNNIVTEFVRLHPLLRNHHSLSDFVEIEKKWRIVYVDLTLDEDTLWQNFKKENRKAIRKAQKYNIEIAWTRKKEDIEKSYEIYLEAMKKINADESHYFSKSFFINTLELLQDNAQLFIAKYMGEIIAFSIMVGMGKFAHDFLRASREQYLHMRPNNLLVYHILLWGKNNGYKIFSLQGGQSENDGIFRFKLTFSNATAEFYTYSKIHDENKYQMLCRAKENYDKTIGKAPSRLDYFPRYRA